MERSVVKRCGNHEYSDSREERRKQIINVTIIEISRKERIQNYSIYIYDTIHIKEHRYSESAYSPCLYTEEQLLYLCRNFI